MEKINLSATYEERTSSKTGKSYKAVFVRLSDNYEKLVMLSVPEQILVENSAKSDPDDFSTFNY